MMAAWARRRPTRAGPNAAVTGQDLEDVTAALLGRPLDLSRRDVSREAHVSLHSARRFWQALGFPLVDNDELLFTQADVDALADRGRARAARRAGRGHRPAS